MFDFPVINITKNTIANIAYIISNAFITPYSTPPTSLHCFIIGNEVMISDISVNSCNNALIIINIIRNTITFMTFTAIVLAVSYTISFCVFVTASSTYFSK